MKLCLLDADYVDKNGKTVIRLFCKDKNGKTIVAIDENFDPYFYVLPKKGEVNKIKKRIEEKMKKVKDMKVKKIETVERILNGEKQKFLKIFCNSAVNVSKIRDAVKDFENGIIEEYEYSINFYKRYLIDKEIEGMEWIEVKGKEDESLKESYQADSLIKMKSIKPLEEAKIPKLKLLAFDIECVGKEGKNKIVMISMFGKKFKKVLTYQKDKYPKYVELVKDEEEMLKRFVELIQEQDPDIILGFNSDQFDFQVLRERAEEYSKFKLMLSRDKTRMKFERRARVSSARLKGRVHVDLFSFIDSILSPQLQTEVLTLDAVSAELLGESKIEMEYEEILEAWKKKKDLAKLAEYCLKDSELAYRLGDFILPQIFEISRLSGQLLFDASRMTYSQLVESYLSKKAFAMNSIILNQPKWKQIQRRRRVSPYTGGFVKEPIGGLHEEIGVMDFRSLYPSIIATFNISPETLNCKCCRKNGYEVPEKDYWFCKNEKGFVSTVIKELIERRMKVKQKMKKLKKGSKEWSSLDKEQFAIKTIANATYGYFGFPGSKWYCRQCAEASASWGRFFIKKVINEAKKEGFTVIYSDTDSMFVKVDGNLKKKIKKFLKNTNEMLPGIIELDLQGIYKRGIFIPRGVGPGTAKKRYALIDKEGNLTIRGLETVRRDWCNLAKDVQRKVLELVLSKKDVKGAVKFVKKVIKKLRKNKIKLKDLTIHEQLTKSISKYKTIGPHVAVAKKIKKRGGSVSAGMIIMFVITKGKGSISERAEPIEDIDIKDIDQKYYITHQIIPAALRVLTVLGVTKEELLGQSLKNFLVSK